MICDPGLTSSWLRSLYHQATQSASALKAAACASLNDTGIVFQDFTGPSVKSHGLIGLWFLKMATWFSRKSRKSTSSTWQTPLLVFPPFRSPLQKEANLSAAGGYVNNATMKLSPQGERSENTGKTRRSEMVRWDGQVWLKGHHY